MLGHENAGSTLVLGTFLAGALDFSVVIYFVKLEHGELDVLVHMLLLLGLSVVLLLALLTPATKTKDQVKGGFFLDIVVTQGAAIFQLLAGKNQTLLIRGDTFLVLDLLLDVFNGIAGFDIKSDGLAREGFDKDLHDGFFECTCM